MLSRWVRTWDSNLLRPLLQALRSAGLTPNTLTLISLALFVGAGLFVARGALAITSGLLLAGGIADGLDGELARVTDRATAFGGFLDSICDHLGDFAFSLGLLWLFLAQHDQVAIILVFLALFGSMLGSLVRSRAGIVGIVTKDIGLATRFERTLILLLGCLTTYLVPALWLLAALTNLSAAQRIFHTIRRVRVPPTPS
jgi:phosphatidylglycerophosphate synthase